MDVATSRIGRRALGLYFGVLQVFLYTPIAILLAFSFNDNVVVAFPLEGFTLQWYRDFFSNDALVDALKTSAVVAALASVTAVALAVPAAIALVRRRFSAKPFVSSLLLSPLVIPYVALGISLLILFRTLGVPLSTLTIAIGHTVLTIPFAVLVLIPRLQRIDVALEEAARDLGATRRQTFRFVTLPLIVPAILSSLLIAFTLSFDEVVVASFTAGQDPTFPIYLFSQLRLPQRLPQVIAVAVVVMGMSLTVVVAAEVGRRLAERRLESAPVPSGGHGGGSVPDEGRLP